MRAVLLYNPAAGRIPVRLFVHRAVDELTRLGWAVKVAESQSGRHTTEVAQQAAEEEYDALFAAGGDGTVGQAAAGLAGSGTALGILPAGTSNVMAVELGLPVFGWSRWWALEESVRSLVAAPVFSLDVGLCNAQPFLLWAGMGLDALTIQNIEPRVRLEKYLSVPQYAAQTIWNATFWHGMDLCFWVNDEKVEGHFLVAVVNNVRTYLGGMATLSPDAHLDDGQMDLWLFSGDNVVDAVRHAFGMMAGRHLTALDTRRISFRTLRVESSQPFSVQMDGEPRPAVLAAEFSVFSRSLRMMIPPQSLSLLKHAALDRRTCLSTGA
jgi:diacylglycerol kinase (ATP)